jgi:hypothetical protein
MTIPRTIMAPAPQLTLPDPEPVPADGCDVCTALGKEREEARRSGDMSKVSDCTVEIAAHPHARGRK